MVLVLWVDGPVPFLGDDIRMAPPVFDAYRESRLSFKEPFPLTKWILVAFVLLCILFGFMNKSSSTSESSSA